MNRQVKFLFWIFICLLFFGLSTNNAWSTNTDPIGMVTGSSAGTYIQFGRNIAEVAEEVGLAIWVKESHGSIDNINRMKGKENAAFGIVQSDVLNFLKEQNDPDMQSTARKLVLIFPFYNEEVHLFARKGIESINDLDGKKVIIDAKGSGTWLTATVLLNNAGVSPANYKNLNASPRDAVALVLSGEADAMFYVAGKPTTVFKQVEEMSRKREWAEHVRKFHFVSLDADPKILEKGYVRSVLEPSDYSWLEKEVPTIAVKSMLVAFDFSSKATSYYKQRCNQLGQLGQVLRSRIDYLRANGHSKWNEVNLEEKVGSWSLDKCSRESQSQEEIGTGKLFEDIRRELSKERR